MPCCSKIKTGDLRHRITIEENTQTSNGAGGFNDSWESLVDAWAKITPKNKSQMLEAMDLKEQVSHEIIIRYRSDVQIGNKNRIKFGTRYFKPLSIINLEERDKYFVINAVENEEAGA